MGSVVVPRARTDSIGNAQSEFDYITGETVTRYQAVILDEDFIGPSHTAGIPTTATVGYPWIKKTVQTGGSPSVAPIANAAGGVIRNSIDATSEKQEATLYAADVLNWDMTKSAVFECRAKLSTLPSAAAVEAVWGLQSAWIDGPDNASYYAQFQAQASGAVNMRTKDGVNTVSNATGTTVLATDWHNYRIDATDPTNVLFFIDGALVSANNMAFAATGSNAILQPYFSVYKASGTGTGAIDIDMVQVAMNRS
jgi:hypothetical protein